MTIERRIEALEKQTEDKYQSLAAALIAARGKPRDLSPSPYPVIEAARARVRRMMGQESAHANQAKG